MTAAHGVKVVGYFDCPGGGQIVVRDNVAYIGHIAPPHGTTIVDVSDPAEPRQLAEISIPEGKHSHKVRVENGAALLLPSGYFPSEGGQGKAIPGYRVIEFATPLLDTVE